MTKDLTVADALFQALLDHHKQISGNASLDKYKLYPKGCLITYSLLCERAKVPFMTQSSGGPLHTVAVFCNEKHWPPINALAVNKDSRYPGPGYFEAPGCAQTLEGWVEDVKRVMEFTEYPYVTPML